VRLSVPDTVLLGGTKGPRLTIGRSYERGDDPVTVLARIGASNVGCELPVAALLAITAEAKTTRYAPGTMLIACGQAVTALIIVLEGCASARNPSGQELGRIGPGETLGELGVVTHEPASATVIATTDVVCAELSADRFRTLLSDQPGIAHTLLIQVGRRLVSTLRAPAAATDLDLSVTLIPQ
jgi:CRP-like cAMP-binding protein